MSPRSVTASDPTTTLDAVFFALADGTRRGVLARLRHGEATAGSLADGFHVTRPAVSRHLRVLRRAALVTEQRRGRERVYTLVPERLRLINEWIADYRVFWSARLHDLKDFVEAMPDEPPPRRRRRPRRAR
jgi:DNA-binding transcriptional ArsR family regulator